ncbi:MAG: hypothetical protein GY789_23200 [Hyphomicrobiales bacterium]|nr:hypothetical protein [Hyphomicrobiales bacterium]
MDNTNGGDSVEAIFNDQALGSLKDAGLFKKIRNPFPVPVGFSNVSEHVSLVCTFGHRMALLQCPDTDTLDIFKSILGPYLVGGNEVLPTSDIVALQYHGDGYGVFVNSKPVFGQCDFPLARHFVLREIAISLAGRQQTSAIFHAGVVGTHEKVVVLAANSGSGKSTLTATLAAQGYIYHGDDLCCLVGNNCGVAPFPTRIGLKTGSWSLPDLKSFGIGDIKRTFVGDGHIKQVMPKSVADPSDTAKIAAFVFPAYSNDSEFKLTGLSKLDALQRLFSSGTRLTGRYPTIRPLTETLETVPAYELTYNQTYPAMNAIAELLAE